MNAYASGLLYFFVRMERFFCLGIFFLLAFSAKGLLMAVRRIGLLLCLVLISVCSVLASPFLSSSLAAPLAEFSFVDRPLAAERPNFLSAPADFAPADFAPADFAPADSFSANSASASALLRLFYTANTRGALFPCPT